MNLNWKSELLNSISYGNPEKYLEKSLGFIQTAYKARIPEYYFNLIDWKNPESCPIALQALPQDKETDPELPEWAREWSQIAFGRNLPWTQDSIGDLTHLKAPRLTHRYGNRALLHASSLCAMYCRFCFRKDHLNDDEKKLYEGDFSEAYAYLEKHTEIRELILTGGDPLSMTDSWFESFSERLRRFPHIRTLRIHTRMPVTLPSRITDELLNALKHSGKNVVIVTHFNHPKELTELAFQKLENIRLHGISLYNQSVLLNKINNHSDILAELFQTLYEWGVKPFYLHHPDWTEGTFHFRTSIEEGQTIMRKLAGLIAGPAVPKYMLDIPNGYGKIDLLDPHFIQPLEFKSDSQFSGALYRIQPPQTLQNHLYNPLKNPTNSLKYLNLHKLLK